MRDTLSVAPVSRSLDKCTIFFRVEPRPSAILRDGWDNDALLSLMQDQAG
jgi:hypothetical protein